MKSKFLFAGAVREVPNKPKLMLGITCASSTVLIAGQGRYFVSKGYDVFVLGPSGGKIEGYCKKEGCRHLAVEMEREISMFSDLLSLLTLIRIIWKISPDIVNFGTPKISLLGLCAAFLLRVPMRVYTSRGLRYEHEIGLKKFILIAMEKLTGLFAHSILYISDSLREKASSDGVHPQKKALVIPPGSSNGVDLTRFSPKSVCESHKNLLQKQLSLDGKFVFGFVGRLIERKGIAELVRAFVDLRRSHDNVKLILVGGVDEAQFSNQKLLRLIRQHPNIEWLGSQEDIPLHLSIMDVFVLPAWWEGFGNVLIQAAAMGVPVISTQVTGCRDAVCDGFNGTLIPANDVEALKAQMERYLENAELRRDQGFNGRLWAERFKSQIIWDGLDKIYRGEPPKFDNRGVAIK